jgi:hypothetical protein
VKKKGIETGRKESGSQKSESPSQLIDARIKELGDWRGGILSRLRTLVKEADPEVVEEWKWRGFRCGRTTGRRCQSTNIDRIVAHWRLEWRA